MRPAKRETTTPVVVESEGGAKSDEEVLAELGAFDSESDEENGGVMGVDLTHPRPQH